MDYLLSKKKKRRIKLTLALNCKQNYKTLRWFSVEVIFELVLIVNTAKARPDNKKKYQGLVPYCGTST